MSDLVGNPEDRFSQNEAHIISGQLFNFNFEDGPGRYEATPEGRKDKDYSYMGKSVLTTVNFLIVLTTKKERTT